MPARAPLSLARADVPARLAALADDGRAQPLPPAPASPWLARYGIESRPGDGVVAARATMLGQPVLVVAQDERFCAGTIGAMHADALRAAFDLARRKRPAAVVALFASAGVRLHEANAAEIATARALRALLDARAEGIPVLAVACGDLFGGASVLACACDRLALLPHVRFGLSGPKVIETLHGREALDASDRDAVLALYGASSRAHAGIADLVCDEPHAVRAWLAQGMRDAIAFPLRVAEMQQRLADRVGAAHDDAPQPRWLDDDGRGVLRLRAAEGVFGPHESIAADAALLAADDGDLLVRRPLLIVEDSAGHPVTPAAESLGVSQYLAHHASVIAMLRARGHRVTGFLAGTGHSAAFFVNALQADDLCAAPASKVVAMAPDAVARVTGLDAVRLARAVDDDLLFGHPIRHFAALGGVDAILPDEPAVRARIAESRQAAPSRGA